MTLYDVGCWGAKRLIHHLTTLSLAVFSHHFISHKCYFALRSHSPAGNKRRFLPKLPSEIPTPLVESITESFSRQIGGSQTMGVIIIPVQCMGHSPIYRVCSAAFSRVPSPLSNERSVSHPVLGHFSIRIPSLFHRILGWFPIKQSVFRRITVWKI